MFYASEFKHEYTKSYFKFIEPISKDYRVFINEKEIPVYTCRISDYPFNCVWPGHQRPFDQTVAASFVNLVGDEELTVRVVANRSYQRAMLKPYSKEIPMTEQDGEIQFRIKPGDQLVLELDSYHHCLYLFYSKPILCENPESVTYYFGPGIHFPGKITLKSNESVYVDANALVYGCIYAEDAENIRIFGNGVLDDTQEERVLNYCYENYTNGNFKMYDCKNITVEGVLMKNSAIWCINLFHCFDVTIDDVKVFGQWRYNTDGIDIVNCQDVVIRNSFVHSFDDTITIKGIDRYKDTDNRRITIEHCVLWCDWGRCCEIGLETACLEYSDIIFRDCDVLRAGGVAIDIQNGDCAEVHDILFEDIRVEYNDFDTPEVYQHSDDMVYDRKDEMKAPALVSFVNNRFRTEETERLWGVPVTVPDLDFSAIEYACVHDITVRNIKVYYDEKIPRCEGKRNVPIIVKSFLEDVTFYRIFVEDVCVNGEPLTKENAIIELEQVIDSEIL